jgi:hypothetical protein
VEHESRVHIDIETDDIAAEVARLTKLGARVVDRLERWVVMEAADRPTLLRRQGTASRLPEECQPLGLTQPLASLIEWRADGKFVQWP